MSAEAIPGPADGPYTIYTGQVTNWSMIAGSAIALLPLLGLGQGSRGHWPDLAIPLLLTGLGIVGYALTGSNVRTTAGPRGLTVHLGILGWPRRTYRLQQIADAEVMNLRPWFISGGLWWTPQRTCWTVRSGPTLRLTLRNGRSVTVSTPDPRAAAAILRDARTG